MGCSISLNTKKRPDPTINPPANPVEQPTATPTSLPEPPSSSFRARVKPVQSLLQSDDILSFESDDQDPFESGKENRPQPLPLPPPLIQSNSVLKNIESFKLRNGIEKSEILNPLPLPPSGTIRNFSYDEVTVASSSNFADEFSSVSYKASFGNDKATVTSLNPTTQNVKEFVNEVNTLASLQHPNICKLIGYHAREGSDKRMLFYERLFHGSLDRLLHGRSDGPPIDWNSRMKVALCAAQGLTFLHEEGPFQAMFNEFSTANIQIEKDFSAKLSGYGFVNQIADTDSTKPQERGLLTPKSNVRSFGIVLLELLTGRTNFDNNHPKEERNLIKWSWPYLSDESRLSLIIDPRLKGRFPANAAMSLANIVQKCLKVDPSERPTMRTIANQLKVIQEMKNTSLFPIREPGKNTSRWPSLDRVLNIPPAAKNQPPVLAEKALGRPLSLPPRMSSSIIVFEEIDRQVLKGF